MSSPRIVLYATPGCPYCARVRATVAATTGEPIDERNPFSTPELLRELLSCAAAAIVPTVVVGGRALVGFDSERLVEMLQVPALEPAPVADYTDEELNGDDSELPVFR